MYIIGRGRYAREVYPDGLAAAGAATAALRNRNIAGARALTPYTPSTGGDFIAAVLFTPKVSGVLQISAEIAVQNGGVADVYTMSSVIVNGTGLSVSGGEATIDGWHIGTSPFPTIGGVLGAIALSVGDILTLVGGQNATASAFGISPQTSPLPLGVPVLVGTILAESVAGHSLAQIAIVNLTVLELP